MFHSVLSLKNLLLVALFGVCFAALFFSLIWLDKWQKAELETLALTRQRIVHFEVDRVEQRFVVSENGDEATTLVYTDEEPAIPIRVSGILDFQPGDQVSAPPAIASFRRAELKGTEPTRYESMAAEHKVFLLQIKAVGDGTESGSFMGGASYYNGTTPVRYLTFTSSPDCVFTVPATSQNKSWKPGETLACEIVIEQAEVLRIQNRRK